MRNNPNCGRVADGVPSIRFEGWSYHSQPCELGLMVETSDGLVLVGDDSKTTIFGPERVGTWYPRQAGVAIQRNGKYSRVNYYTGEDVLLYQQEEPWMMHCCDSGIILSDFEPLFHYIPFDGGARRVIWDEHGTWTTVSDGIVIGSWEKRQWVHATVSGENSVIYTDLPRQYYRSGINQFGHVMTVVGNNLVLYHWDGQGPAVARYYTGTCSQGMVLGYTDQIRVAYFGGGERVLWDGHYDDWYGCCDEGLFVIAGGDVMLAPYDGSPPRTLWTGSFERLSPFGQALLVMNPGMVTMIPIVPS